MTWLIIALLFIVLFCIWKRGTILVGLAASQAGKGKTGKALSLYRLAEKVGGMNYSASINCGYFFLKNGYVKEARIIFNQAATMKNLSAEKRQELKSLKALVSWKDGQLDDAIEMLEEVMESYVTSMVYQSLGLLYVLKRDKEKALKFCLAAYEYNPDDNVIMDNLAEAYVLCGETEKAMEIYKELLERNPHFPDAYYGYGILLIQNGRRKEGVEYIGQALTKNFSFLSAVTRERVENVYYAHKEIVEKQ